MPWAMRREILGLPDGEFEFDFDFDFGVYCFTERRRCPFWSSRTPLRWPRMWEAGITCEVMFHKCSDMVAFE